MDLINTARRGDLLKLSRLLGSTNAIVNFRNTNYNAINVTAERKALYCAECLQRVHRRESHSLLDMLLGNHVSCDWPQHSSARTSHEHTAEMCCCSTSSGGRCNWLICADCFLMVTFDLKTSRQICKYEEGYTALIAAASAGHLDCIKLLLAHRADVNLADPDGFTPLMAAVCVRQPSIVRLLLRHGANVNSTTTGGVCALYMACEVGDPEIVEILMSSGPDLSIRESSGASMLHAAAQFGHVEVIQLLLSRGFSTAVTNSAGRTPLQLLRADAPQEMVQLLAERNVVSTPRSMRGIPFAGSDASTELDDRLPSLNARRAEVPAPPALYMLDCSTTSAPEEALSEANLANPGVEKILLKQQRGAEEDIDDRYFAKAFTQAAKPSSAAAAILRASSRDDSEISDPVPRSASIDTTSSLPSVRQETVIAATLRELSALGDDSSAASAAQPWIASHQKSESLSALPKILQPMSSPVASPRVKDLSSIPRAYSRPAKPVVPELKSPKPTAAEELKKNLSPPLPLIRFNATNEKEIAPAKTITGEKIRSILNLTGPCAVKRSVPLCDPMRARKLAKWFIKRSFREINWRQMESYGNHIGAAAGTNGEDAGKIDLCDIVVYESLLYTESAAERSERNAGRVPEEQILQERYERLCNPPTSREGSSFGGSANSSSAALNTLGHSSSNRDLAALAYAAAQSVPCHTPSLRFDGEFESGNLEKAVRVIGRESVLNPRPYADSFPDMISPSPVDQEYDLTLRNDVNTDGNIQWYYFGVSAGSSENATARSASTGSSQETGRGTPAAGVSEATASRNSTPSQMSPGMTPMKFPLRVRFNIINMQKKDSLYNYGMRPASFSENQLFEEDWVHRGDDVCYYRSGLTIVKAKRGKADKKKISLQHQYTLTFTYTFEQPDTVYFAHTFPYTYTDLQLSLCRMEQRFRHSGFFHQRTLCHTLAGNSCDIISISERSGGMVESKNKPAIILTSRVHPGESNSSFMIQGFLDFITSECPEAIKLRKTFVFHIIPMLNPDGVIHGNYRCSLAATDLNRRYFGPHPSLHPTILAKKNFIRTTSQNRNILLYLDLHGHSKLKNAFLYGCDITLQSEKITKHLVANMAPEDIKQRRIFSRVFPKVLSTVSNANQDGYFSYKDCAFVIDKSKSGTGRVVCWRELGISASYTIEASFCGNGDNREAKILKRAAEGTGGSGGSTGGSAKMTPTATSKSFRNMANSALQRPRSNSVGGDSSAGGSVGIAYNDAPTAEEPPGTEGEGDTDAAGEEEGTSGKKSSGKSKSLKKGKSGKTMRRSSTTPALGRVQENELDNEAALEALLQRYDTLTHYRKEDLLNMGGDIGLAIFHFANLSHSSVENELKIATSADLEEKARARRLNLNQCRNGNMQRLSSASEKVRKDKPAPQNEIAFESSVSEKVKSRSAPKPTERAPNVHQGHVHSAAWPAEGDSGSAEITDASGGDVYESDLDLNELEPLMLVAEEGAETAAAAGGASAAVTAGIAASDQGDDSGEESGSESGSQDGDSGGAKATDPAVSAADLARLLRECSRTNVNLLEADMVDRSLLQPGVFSAAALEQIMQTHPDEFLCEGSTANVGMRMKCEYNIRRGLRLAGDIKLTDQALKQHQAAYQSQLEEENASMDGSDSNPSVDNIPAAKMLKSVKKLKDTSNLVGALKKAAVRKKKKELELVRKLEKKEARKLAKQMIEAKRITEEAEQERAAQVAKEAAALAAAQANAKAQQAAEAVAEEMREKVAARRKSSIFQSAPKHAPMYRLAPEDAKQAQQLLPMKIVNFKDHDNTQGPQFHHGASAVDPPVRVRSSGDLAHGDSSPHNLTLSMASLTSAVNKLYFQPVGEMPDASAATPAINVSAASNASALLSSTRRNSLHNSFINPAVVANAQAGFEMPPAWEFSPRGAALRPIVHNMAPLLPASAASGEISQRERERLTVSSGFDRNPSAGAADRAPTQQSRPKSSSATSKRKIY